MGAGPAPVEVVEPCVRATARAPCRWRAAERRLVGGGGGPRRDARDRAPLRVLARRRPAPARPPLGLAARRRRRAVPAWSTTAAFGWTDAGWRGRAAGRRACSTSCHVGTFSAAGTFDGGDRAPRPPGRPRRRRHRADAGRRVLRRRGAGATTASTCSRPHHAYGGPDGLKRLVDACHGAGLGVVFDVVYNHLGPAGNYLPEFGPYFTDRHRTDWGDAGQLRRAGQRRGPPLRDRQRADVAARLPRRRAAPRRRARHRRRLGPHILEQLAAEVDGAGRARWAGRCS